MPTHLCPTGRSGLFSPLPRPRGAEPNLAALGMGAGYTQCVSPRRNKGAHSSFAGVLFSYPCVQGLNLEARVWGVWRRELRHLQTSPQQAVSREGRGEAWSQVSEAPGLTARKKLVGEAGERLMRAAE